MPSDCFKLKQPKILIMNSHENQTLKGIHTSCNQSNGGMITAAGLPNFTENHDGDQRSHGNGNEEHPRQILDGFTNQGGGEYDHVNLNIEFPPIRGSTIDTLPLSDEPDELLKLHVHLNDDTHASPSDQSSVSSPVLSPTGVHTPIETFHDVNTQMSLCERSARLKLDESTCLGLDTNSPFFSIVSNAADHNDKESTSRSKVRKSQRNSDASTASHTESGQEVLDTPVSSQFVFEKFGSLVSAAEATATSETPTRPASIPQFSSSSKRSSGIGSKVGGRGRKVKEQQSMNALYPARSGPLELKILTQPESQHRARYMTEGSRGAIKEKSQQGHPVIQLTGYEGQDKLPVQVFIGNDTGKIKPHGFYQACKVCGKNSTQCIERDIDGTTVIELDLDPKEDYRATIDCVGILKLRNADVEQRIGIQRSKKKSTKARLVFRTFVPKGDGSSEGLQVASTPILCTQPAGAPEVCKKSISEGPVTGGQEMFIIGKNFTKGTRVLFEEKIGEQTLWVKEADIDQDYFQQSHLICIVPEYKDPSVKESVEVAMTIQSGGRVSEPTKFTYVPVVPLIKEETHVPMDTSEQPSLAKMVSPEALELNRQFQMQEAHKDSSSNLFSCESKGEPPEKMPALRLSTEQRDNSLSFGESPQPTGQEQVQAQHTATQQLISEVNHTAQEHQDLQAQQQLLSQGPDNDPMFSQTAFDFRQSQQTFSPPPTQQNFSPAEQPAFPQQEQTNFTPQEPNQFTAPFNASEQHQNFAQTSEPQAKNPSFGQQEQTNGFPAAVTSTAPAFTQPEQQTFTAGTTAEQQSFSPQESQGGFTNPQGSPQTFTQPQEFAQGSPSTFGQQEFRQAEFNTSFAQTRTENVPAAVVNSVEMESFHNIDRTIDLIQKSMSSNLAEPQMPVYSQAPVSQSFPSQAAPAPSEPTQVVEHDIEEESQLQSNVIFNPALHLPQSSPEPAPATPPTPALQEPPKQESQQEQIQKMLGLLNRKPLQTEHIMAMLQLLLEAQKAGTKVSTEDEDKKPDINTLWPSSQTMDTSPVQQSAIPTQPNTLPTNVSMAFTGSGAGATVAQLNQILGNPLAAAAPLMQQAKSTFQATQTSTMQPQVSMFQQPPSTSLQTQTTTMFQPVASTFPPQTSVFQPVTSSLQPPTSMYQPVSVQEGEVTSSEHNQRETIDNKPMSHNVCNVADTTQPSPRPEGAPDLLVDSKTELANLINSLGASKSDKVVVSSQTGVLSTSTTPLIAQQSNLPQVILVQNVPGQANAPVVAPQVVQQRVSTTCSSGIQNMLGSAAHPIIIPAAKLVPQSVTQPQASIQQPFVLPKVNTSTNPGQPAQQTFFIVQDNKAVGGTSVATPVLVMQTNPFVSQTTLTGGTNTVSIDTQPRIIAAANPISLNVAQDGENGLDIMDHESSSAPNNPSGNSGIGRTSAPKSPSALLYKLLTEREKTSLAGVTIAVSEAVSSQGNMAGNPSNHVNRKRPASGGAGLPPLSVDDASRSEYFLRATAHTQSPNSSLYVTKNQTI